MLYQNMLGHSSSSLMQISLLVFVVGGILCEHFFAQRAHFIQPGVPCVENIDMLFIFGVH